MKAKIRYLHRIQEAKIISKIGKRSYKVEFSRPQRAITFGQSIVFYQGQEVLGGGIISN
jgi:tRNA-specific 2-thiouridylase